MLSGKSSTHFPRPACTGERGFPKEPWCSLRLLHESAEVWLIADEAGRAGCIDHFRERWERYLARERETLPGAFQQIGLDLLHRLGLQLHRPELTRFIGMIDDPSGHVGMGRAQGADNT